MLASQTFFADKITLDRRTNYINITRRSLRISNDALKLLSKTALPILAAPLTTLKTPIELTNATLQIFAIQTDNNYPTKLKLAMSIALGSLMLASLTVGTAFSSLPLAAILLTSYSHSIRTLHRASKLHLSMENLGSKRKIRDTRGEKREKEKKQLFQFFKNNNQAEFKLHAKPYLKKTTPQSEQQKDAELTMIKNAIGVATILIRWAVSVAILSLASASANVLIPLISLSLLVNTIDLLRDTHNIWQISEQEKSLNHRQDELVAGFKMKLQ